MAAELLNVFVGMTNLDVDVSRAADALGFERKRKGVLRELDNEFFAYGPAVRSGEPVRVKAGEILTTHPDYGGLSGKVGPAPPAPEEIRALVAGLARSLEAEVPAPYEQGEEAEDAAAEGHRSGAGTVRVSRDFERDVEREVGRRLEHRVATEVERVAAPLRERIGTLEAAIEEASTDFASGVAVLERTGASRASRDPIGTPEREGRSTGEEAAPPAAEPEPEAPDGTKPAKKRDGRRRLLGALAHLESLGISPVPRATLAAYAGFKPSKDGGGSGTFRDHLAKMGTDGEGLLLSDAGRVRLTDDGREEAARLGVVYHGPRTLAEFHDRLTSGLPEKAAEMLRAIIAHHPEGISREDLAEECGVTMNGTTRGYLADFGRLGLVASKAGRVRPTERLFPEGLE